MKIEALNQIHENYSRVLEQVRQTAVSANRDPAQIRIVVVTKGHPLERLIQAVQAGISLFGENYVEEAVRKITALSPYSGLEWHMIGHVQSRKSRQVCENFHLLHSLDSLKLANRLDRDAGELDICLPVYLECNVSGEESKNGFPAWDRSNWLKFSDEIELILSLQNLRVSGLMTMAPFFDNPELARPYFRRLRELRDFLSSRLPEGSWDNLSMGMSADFQVAVQEGANILRIGTAIMGTRNQH